MSINNNNSQDILTNTAKYVKSKSHEQSSASLVSSKFVNIYNSDSGNASMEGKATNPLIEKQNNDTTTREKLTSVSSK